MKRLATLATVFLTSVILFTSVSVLAADNSLVNPSDVCTGSQADSAACKGRTTIDPISGNNGILVQAANIIAIMAGVAAVIIIIIAGIRFMTSGGDAEKIKNARNSVINALIGIIIIIVSRAIILFVTAKL